MLILSGLANVALGQTNAMLVELEGRVVLSRKGSLDWGPAQAEQVLFPGDRLRTLERSRAVVRLSDLSLLRLSELSHIQLPEATSRRGGFNLLRGVLYFFHRDKPGVMPVTTPTAYAVVLGTEFTVEVSEEGDTRLSLIEGTVQMTNDAGGLTLASGETALATVGSAPIRTPSLTAMNVIQWVLHYPGVLDPVELSLPEGDRTALAESLDAYRNGDLLDALAKYPPGREPTSNSEAAYRAALLMTVGQVQWANQLGQGNLASAVRRLMAAVQFRDEPSEAPPEGASLLLAESYYQQSRSNLRSALALARRAVEVSPTFGFGWARVAELEFSFGRIQAAREAVRRSLELAPRNAQAMTLQGFILAAENRIEEAINAFDKGIALDGANGNAWLGRGLCRIKQGDLARGRADLQVAVTVEPQRAILRSYLAKAFAAAGEPSRAGHELDLAMSMDPNDPTAWLYAALLNHQQNRVNEGVEDLERSKALNNNRSIFRSRELLDQDRAVRSANLAALYRDAGMREVSVHEASRAVASDYANHSAHLFLANSYNELRDPNLVNLRYETPAVSEYLVANLLAPVGATMLSPRVSQQEYARLFERNRLGLSSATLYTSDGTWAQAGSQFGVVDNFSYALDVDWRSRQGHRPNNDLDQFVGSAQFKVQVTPQDSLYFLGAYSEVNSGDVRQYFDESQSSLRLRVKEVQEPNLFAGYHREWAPGVHTLVLGARLDDTLQFREPNAFIRTLVRDSGGVLIGEVDPEFSTFDADYQSEFQAWSAEVQQIFEQSVHTLITGARYQTGNARNRAELGRDPFAFPPVFTDPAALQEFETDLERIAGYAYYHLRLIESLQLIGGVTYDHLRYPVNADLPPLTPGETTREQVSPKAGIVWTPTDSTMMRAAYTRSLGGVFYDSSIRLEPTQVAGFVQSYRNLIPESVLGSVPGSRFETVSGGLQHRFPTRTYLILETEWLRSEGTRSVGVFDYTDAPPFLAVPSTTRQRLSFDERSVGLALHQLIGREWAVGGRYRVARAAMESRFTDLDENEDLSTTLHSLGLSAIWQNAAGFFTRAEGAWYVSDDPLNSDSFGQLNLLAGYRFAQRRAEVTLGLLNLTDQSYQLNPLNAIVELPRERTFLASFRFNF